MPKIEVPNDHGATLCPNCKMLRPLSATSCNCGWIKVEQIVTEEMYLKGHHLNPAYAKEYDDEVKANIAMLLPKINSLLSELGIKNVKVNSGWRPQAYNIKIGGARRSRHIIGQAIDLADPDGNLKAIFEANLDKLKARGLSMEDGRYTKGWCHLQCPPPRSGRTIFIPYAGPPK